MSSSGPGATPATQIPATGTATPASPLPGTVDCTSDDDCVPAECCHASSCTADVAKRPCTFICTASCEGPLDCGAGKCGCVNGKCRVIPVSPVSSPTVKLTAITITASPQRYSPVMSSTPGIGLEPVITGFSAENASFTWKTTYGYFLTWNSPDFRINQLGDSATNHGEKIYWSFIDMPTSAAIPVTITVNATDTGSGQPLGHSAVTLAWEDNYSVIVRDGE